MMRADREDIRSPWVVIMGYNITEKGMALLKSI
jgi:hypothetical protein